MPKKKTVKKEETAPRNQLLKNQMTMQHHAIDMGAAQAYQIIIDLGESKLVGSGNTMLEALQSIPRPVKIFTKGVVTATGAGRKAVLPLMPAKIKRLFYPLAQGVLSKQLEYLMK